MHEAILAHWPQSTVTDTVTVTDTEPGQRGLPPLLIVVSFGSEAEVERYRQHNNPPFLLMTDPTRSSYKAFDFGRGSVARIWGIKSARRYLALGSDGLRNLRIPTEDTQQLGGDVVIGADGRITYLYRSEGPDDRPPASEIVAALGG